ncbi:MAG: preprotein translocase subunit SecG [Oscillospiraceae bacterium]
MGIFEIISAVLLLISSVFIILMVLSQESKGNGLSGAIGGGEMMQGEGRSRNKDAILAKYTKYAAIVFFVATILVSVFSIYLKK